MCVSVSVFLGTLTAAGQVPTIGAPPPALGAATEALPIPPPPQPAASQMTRQARRLYIGSIPFGISEDAMLKFFNEKMAEASLITAAGMPVLAVQINMDKNFAFVEVCVCVCVCACGCVRGRGESSNALPVFVCIGCFSFALWRRPLRPWHWTGSCSKDSPSRSDGPRTTHHSPLVSVVSRGVGGMLIDCVCVCVCVCAASSDLVTHLPGVVSTVVQDGPFKVFCGGLPTYLSDDQVCVCVHLLD